jgi:hypothetical protein
MRTGIQGQAERGVPTHLRTAGGWWPTLGTLKPAPPRAGAIVNGQESASGGTRMREAGGEMRANGDDPMRKDGVNSRRGSHSALQH